MAKHRSSELPELVWELSLGYVPYKEAKIREVEYAAELRLAGYAVLQN
jgi:hypothetical protein